MNPAFSRYSLYIHNLDPELIGADSIDLRIVDHIKIYKNSLPEGVRPWLPKKEGVEYTEMDWYESHGDYVKDCNRPAHYCISPKYALDPKTRKERETIETKIPESGLYIRPGVFYLSSIYEYVAMRNITGLLEGLSTRGRDSLFIHYTAPFIHSGQGWDSEKDAPFNGKGTQLTLEMSCTVPTVLYPFKPIAQMYFFDTELDVLNHLYNGRYNKQEGATIALDSNKAATR
jgi:deoxycytidine triphosphate deaminase